jgi:Tfp pilus assembly protein PilP
MKNRSFKTLLIGAGCWTSVVSFAETTITIEKKKNDAFYSPFGKRDPFRIPTVGGLGEDASVGPLQRFHVDQFKLRAIIRGMGEPKAMFQDPKGRSHIVSQGDLIGIEKATVSRIIKSEVILTERTYNYLGKESLLERVIALPQDTELDPLQLVGEGKTPEAKRSAASESEAEEQERSSNTPSAKGASGPASAAGTPAASAATTPAAASGTEAPVKKDLASVLGVSPASATVAPGTIPTNPVTAPVAGINEGVPQSSNSAAVPSREVVSTSPVPEPIAPVPATGAPIPVTDPPPAVPTPTP